MFHVKQKTLKYKRQYAIIQERKREVMKRQMGKTIAIANQKGGVGKTTTAVNLCAALQSRDKSVLLIDCDPQGNATTGMGINKEKIKSIYDVMFRDVKAWDAVVATKYGHVIGSQSDLAGANVELVNMPHRETILKDSIRELKEKYTYIIIDCPPSLELLTINALTAADTVLIPVQTEFYALEGVSDLINTIKIIKKRMNPSLEIEGFVLTMFDHRTKLSSDVEDNLRQYFPGKVFQTSVPRNVRLSEAPSHGKPCIAYDKSSKGSRAYLHLANELIKRNRA